jgi:micrococcal nuclease
MFTYLGAVEKVVDGDTLDLQIDLGFGVFTRQRVRLLGLNAPEHNTADGKAATAFVQAWTDQHGPVFTVTTEKDKKEKYGRYLATIYADGVSLNEDLVAAGLALPWDGNGKRPVPAS